MAVGDFLIMMSAANTAMSFQPAGTNVWMIISTSNGGQGSTENLIVTDGAGNCQLYQTLNANEEGRADYFSSKVCINNTYYYSAPAGGANARSWFSAVQVE